MPIFTICISGRRIVTVFADPRSVLLEDLTYEENHLRIYLTTWTVRGKPVWDGNMKPIAVQLATPAEAAKFQRALLDEHHPNDEDPYEGDVWHIIAPIDAASHEAAARRIQQNRPPGTTIDDKGEVVPLQ